MIIGNGINKYEWIDNWARIPESETGKLNGRTHGIAVSQSGKVIVFHQADPALLVFNDDGSLYSAWGSRFSGAHGLTLVKEGEREFIWITDEFSGEVAELSLTGETVMLLSTPPHPAYLTGKFSPTWVAVDEERFGGNGDIWVADGYGMSLVHKFNKRGRYVYTLSGKEGEAGRFNCPHSVFIDRRRSRPELLIADRGNKRIQVYDTDGNYNRSFGESYLSCPCSFVTYGDQLIIPELSAKLTIVDINDLLACYIGDNEQTCRLPGWPDHPNDLLTEGKFNSPHSAAADYAGNIYVVEWIKGGRITKLQKLLE
ncbi:MAG: hypothetical protein ACM34K_16155 [Bacillota bacterium]